MLPSVKCEIHVSGMVSDRYKEDVYRLVYVVSQMPILRQRIQANADGADDIISMLWGAFETPVAHQVFARLMRANADEVIRELVQQADLRSMLQDGTLNGFYLTNSPPSLGPNATLAQLRKQAAPYMTTTTSRTGDLNDRLASRSNALWFVIETQKLVNNFDDFKRELDKLKSIVYSEEYRRWFHKEYLFSPPIANRASEHFLCAELALAVGLLQVVVIDDQVIEVNENKVLKSVTTNAYSFRNAYMEAKNVEQMYEAWKNNMKEHNNQLRVLQKLVDLCNLADPEYQALLYTVSPISSVKISNGETRYLEDKSYRSSITALLENIRQGVGRVTSQIGKQFSDKRKYTYYAQWLHDCVSSLRKMSGKIFVFSLPKDLTKGDDATDRYMRPGWHLYASRDRRDGLQYEYEDKDVIKQWMQALIDSEVDTKRYSPVDTRMVDKCESVFDRTAEMLGMTDESNNLTEDAKELRRLACNTSGSCLDKQYQQVRDDENLVSSEDRSNELARLLLNYNDIGCGDVKTGTDKNLTKILCERRVRQACDNTSASECGSMAFGKGADAENKLVEKVCAPTSELRNQLSQCPIPTGNVQSKPRYVGDAQCISNVIDNWKRENADCFSDLNIKCGEGRQGWALLQALQQRDVPVPSPVTIICTRRFKEVDKIKMALDDILVNSPRDSSVCSMLKKVIMFPDVDVQLQELAERVRAHPDMACNKRMSVALRLEDDNIKQVQEFIDQVQNSIIDKSSRSYLPGGMVISSGQYQHMKEAYLRILTPGASSMRAKLETVFKLIEVQCFGMAQLGSDDVLMGEYGVSKFVHYMLYPKFRELARNTDVEYDLYTKVVGCEYIDWALLVLDSYTKDGITDGVIKAALGEVDRVFNDTKNPFVVMKSSNYEDKLPKPGSDEGTDRSKFIENPYVMEHMYKQLYGWTKRGNDVAVMQNIAVITRLNDIKAIREATNSKNVFEQTLKSLSQETQHAFKIFIQMGDGGAGAGSGGEASVDSPGMNVSDGKIDKRPIVRPFRNSTLRDLIRNDQDWWRQVLTITTFAPRLDLSAKYIEDFVNNNNDALNQKNFDELHAALMCIASSSEEIAYAGTGIVKTLAAKIERAKSPFDIKVLVEPNQTTNVGNAADILIKYISIVTLMYTYDRQPVSSIIDTKQLYARITLSGENDDADKKRKMQDLLHTMEKVRDTVIQAEKDDLPVKLSGIGTSATASTAGASASLLRQLYDWAKQSFVTSTDTDAMVGPLAAMGTFSTNTDVVVVTDSQFALFNIIKEAQYSDETARSVLNLELAIMCLLLRYGLNETRIEDTNLVSELVHAVRCQIIRPDNTSGPKAISIKTKPANTYDELLPSAYFDISAVNNTITKYDIQLIKEYTEALVTVLPAMIAVRGKLGNAATHRAAFSESMYRACFPNGTTEETMSAFANPFQDFRGGGEGDPNNFLFSDTNENYRRLNVYAAIVRQGVNTKNPMHCFCINTKDNISKILSDAEIGKCFKKVPTEY